MAGGQQGMGQQQGGMMEDSVSLQNTNQMLQQGVTTMSTQAAIENIEGWEQKLENLDASGQVQQVASDMVNTLGDLRSALEGGGQPDAQQVSQAFEQLNSQMQTLMQNASSLNLQDQQQQRLQQLQQSIQQASQELGGGGGGGM
jgi:DNA repair exonuclease SbcCD ATPase subunit